MQLEIFVDEAWTHQGDIGRYWCFYGALFGESFALDRLESALRNITRRYGHKPEIKWKSLNALNEPLYRELAEAALAHIDSADVRFRQMFYDRAIVRVPNHEYEEELSDLDVQFRLCYQFLKHSFGIKQLPPGSEVLVRMDTHSSQRHRENLERYATRIPQQLGRPDVTLRLTYHNSTAMMRIQAVDLLIGAAGFYGNKMYLRRENGAKRISSKQKLKRDFAKWIYDGLRRISNIERSAGGFNWFESTGTGGLSEHRLRKKIHIWKFKPAVYLVDKGWENDHLDKQGRYVSQQLDDVVRSCSERVW